jgi:hypothetical protein
MGNLPTSRTITLGPSDPVPSALLDELQDVVISFGNELQGTKKLSVSQFAFHPMAGTTITRDTSGGVSFSGGQGVVAPVPFLVGWTLTKVTFQFEDSATGPTQLLAKVQSRDDTGAVNTIALSGLSAGSGANQSVALTVGSPAPLVVGTAYNIQLFINAGSGTCKVHPATVEYTPSSSV